MKNHTDRIFACKRNFYLSLQFKKRSIVKVSRCKRRFKMDILIEFLDDKHGGVYSCKSQTNLSCFTSLEKEIGYQLANEFHLGLFKK